eukprot:tig00000681_g3136.t1
MQPHQRRRLRLRRQLELELAGAAARYREMESAWLGELQRLVTGSADFPSSFVLVRNRSTGAIKIGTGAQIYCLEILAWIRRHWAELGARFRAVAGEDLPAAPDDNMVCNILVDITENAQLALGYEGGGS